MIPNTSATAAAITTSHGIWSNMRPTPIVSTSLNGTSRTSTPPVMISAKPSAIPSVPSVTISGGTRAFVIRTPFSSPQPSPQPSETASPISTTPQLSPPTAFIAFAATTPENTSTDPTDRSIPAVMITYVIPTEITSRIAAFTAMLRMLLTGANASGSGRENTTTI